MPIFEPNEIPEMETGTHTVHVQSIYCNADESRILVNFREECNPASFPLKDQLTPAGQSLKDAGQPVPKDEVLFSGDDGLKRFQHFIHCADCGAVSVNAGEAVPVDGIVKGYYGERNGYHNWALASFSKAG